jgi:hypothetical protein
MVLNRPPSTHLLRPEGTDPHCKWNRAIPAPGHMNVDFEGRVEFDRLRRYRLQRARDALEKSEGGALLLFDVNTSLVRPTGCSIGWDPATWRRSTRFPGNDAIPIRTISPIESSGRAIRLFLMSSSPIRATALLLPDFQCRARHAGSARRLQAVSRMARPSHRADQARRLDRPCRRRVAGCGRVWFSR